MKLYATNEAEALFKFSPTTNSATNWDWVKLTRGMNISAVLPCGRVLFPTVAIPDTTLASETVLGREWDADVEDEAWKDL